MSEFEKLYTVNDIARMTLLTSRTIRNYLRYGSLQGQKIGGQWRFTMENIRQLYNNSVFLGDISKKNRQQVMAFINGTGGASQGKAQVCTVIDYYCENQKEGYEIYEKLVMAIKNKKDDSLAKFDFEYIDKEKKARFTLFGNPDYIIKTLELLK